MKKILTLGLAFIMMFLISGCTGEEREVEYAKAPEATIPEKGTWEGNVYESSYSGITFEKPVGWIEATEDELATIESGDGVYYDMMCQNPVTGSQVAVMYEELLLTSGSITVTEDDYMESVSESLYNSGLDILEQGEKKIGDKIYKSVTVYGEAEDISVMQCSLIRKEGNTMISVIAVAFNDDSLEDILSCFK